MNRSRSQKWAVRLLCLSALTGPALVAQAAPLLAVDMNDRTLADGSAVDSGTQTGYSPYVLPGGVGSTTAYTSTVGADQAIGAGYTLNVATILTYANGGGTGSINDADRNFSAPISNIELYDDVIFNASNTGGIRLRISGGALVANTEYLVSIFAYDHGSGSPRRTASWVDMNNGDAPVLTTSFLGSTGGSGQETPQTDDANKFTGRAITDANGMLSLKGINTTAITPATGLPSQFGVFISGLEINVVPEPTTAVAVAGLMGLVARRRRR